MPTATKIFVGNLPPGVVGDDLRRMFEKMGTVTEADVIKNYGFVHMADENAARAAVSALHQSEFMGSRINVEMSHSKVRQQPGMGAEGECFRCGRKGHLSKSCPEGGDMRGGRGMPRGRGFGMSRGFMGGRGGPRGRGGFPGARGGEGFSGAYGNGGAFGGAGGPYAGPPYGAGPGGFGAYGPAGGYGAGSYDRGGYGPIPMDEYAPYRTPPPAPYGEVSAPPTAPAPTAAAPTYPPATSYADPGALYAYDRNGGGAGGPDRGYGASGAPRPSPYDPYDRRRSDVGGAAGYDDRRPPVAPEYYTNGVRSDYAAGAPPPVPTDYMRYPTQQPPGPHGSPRHATQYSSPPDRGYAPPPPPPQYSGYGVAGY